MNENPEKPVRAGASYWVDFGNIKLKVYALRESSTMPGWWWCRSENGQEVLYRAKSLVEDGESSPS